MPTELILLSNIPGVGAEGDRVHVADGYARNYLLPRRLASPPQAADARRLEALRKIRAAREAEERSSAEELVRRLQSVVCTIEMPSAQKGKIFGGVTAAHITEKLAQQGFVVDRKQIKLERPIHSPGEFSLTVHPHHDVTATLKVVVTTAPAATDASKPSRPTSKKSHPPERGQRPAVTEPASKQGKSTPAPASGSTERKPARKTSSAAKKSS